MFKKKVIKDLWDVLSLQLKSWMEMEREKKNHRGFEKNNMDTYLQKYVPIAENQQ